ncbi:MAG: sugar ABC transporter ATP-binding protein, partial [Pseudomonadota bacterium]
MTFLVEMKGIEKRFPGVHALKAVEFDLRPGEVHALMGENGAGKSTLMKIMSGIYARDGGEMYVNGAPVAPESPRAAQELGIGIIHQELSLMNDLTAAQNVLIGREPRRSFGRLDEAALNRRAAEIFADLNFDMDPRTQVSTQTIARQQLIEIAKALSYNPRVLIMDEPTAALNDVEIAELFAVIRKLKAEGVGIVYISHRMDEIKRIADRVTVLRDGEYIDTVNAADTSLATIIQLMVGREVTHDEPVVPDTSKNQIALEVRNLSRGAQVRDVSFSVRKGEILGFAGLMGAGRTEVARIIFGADPRDRGAILVGGQPVDIRSPAHAVAAGVGYLSEDRKHFGLAVDMTVRA